MVCANIFAHGCDRGNIESMGAQKKRGANARRLFRACYSSSAVFGLVLCRTGVGPGLLRGGEGFWLQPLFSGESPLTAAAVPTPFRDAIGGRVSRAYDVC